MPVNRLCRGYRTQARDGDFPPQSPIPRPPFGASPYPASLTETLGLPAATRTAGALHATTTE